MREHGRYPATGAEAEFAPGSRGRVLLNLKGIRLVRDMHREEFDSLLTATEHWFRRVESDQRFTANDIRAMHRSWLEDIYPWAGEYRTVDLSKGEFSFANARQIPRLMDDLERGPLGEHTPCRPGEPPQVARALAVVHAELVLIHPFREGNGRCARLLASLMGLQAGLPALRFDRFDGKGKPRYFAAVQATMGREYGPLTDLFASVIDETLESRQRP